MHLSAIEVIVIGAVVVLIVFILALRHRKNLNIKIKGPGGWSGEGDASDPTPSRHGVEITNATSKSGGLKAKDATGQGVRVDQVQVEKDIEVTSENSQDQNQRPK